MSGRWTELGEKGVPRQFVFSVKKHQPVDLLQTQIQSEKERMLLDRAQALEYKDYFAELDHQHMTNLERLQRQEDVDPLSPLHHHQTPFPSPNLTPDKRAKGLQNRIPLKSTKEVVHTELCADHESLRAELSAAQDTIHFLQNRAVETKDKIQWLEAKVQHDLDIHTFRDVLALFARNVLVPQLRRYAEFGTWHAKQYGPDKQITWSSICRLMDDDEDTPMPWNGDDTKTDSITTITTVTTTARVNAIGHGIGLPMHVSEIRAVFSISGMSHSHLSNTNKTHLLEDANEALSRIYAGSDLFSIREALEFMVEQLEN